jgi:uncharacterized membrane protein
MLAQILRWFLVLLYLLAGIFHILRPGPFLSITPQWVPWPEATIFVTGLCEIAGSMGLLVTALRKPAGLGLALYAIAVFPANINHAIIDMSSAQPLLGWAYHAPRLLLQPLLVWAALYASQATDWPFRNNKA